MSKKLTKFEVRKSKYVTNLWMWMFVIAIFGRISEYRYCCQSIHTLSIPIFFDTSHHYSTPELASVWKRKCETKVDQVCLLFTGKNRGDWWLYEGIHEKESAHHRSPSLNCNPSLIQDLWPVIRRIRIRFMFMSILPFCPLLILPYPRLWPLPMPKGDYEYFQLLTCRNSLYTGN